MSPFEPFTSEPPKAFSIPAVAGCDEGGAPLVSVVIPAYNAQDLIDETLRSVRSQTHRNLEIIVVDDGSIDQTSGVVRAHIVADPRVTLISQPNRGVAHARNAGWQRAASDLIAFVDADDLWAPTKIQRQLEVLAAGGESMGLVYTWFDVIDEHSCIRFHVKGRKISGRVLSESLLGNFVGHGSSALIRRSALIQCGGFDAGLRDAGAHGCEDLKLYQRIARYHEFGLVPEQLTGYRVATNSMSSDRPRMLRSFMMVGEEAKSLHPELHREINQGIRSYAGFLVREAIVFKNYEQAWFIYKSWSKQHPTDCVLILVSAFWPGVRWRVQWLACRMRLISGPDRLQRFTIGEVE